MVSKTVNPIRVVVMVVLAMVISMGVTGCKKQEPAPPHQVERTETQAEQPSMHPNASGWDDLFAADLSNAVYPEGVWAFDDGVLTASEDQVIWTKKEYGNCVVDLEFKTQEGTNSGVIVYCSDMDNWIPNSVEVQIADDFAQQWASQPKTWQCGAIFGHLAASKSMVKKPGEWNRMTVTCKGKHAGAPIYFRNMKIKELN